MKTKMSRSSRISKLIGILQQDRIGAEKEGDAFRKKILGWRIGRLIKKYYRQLKKEAVGHEPKQP